MQNLLNILLVLALGILCSSCASAVSAGHNTALDGTDLVRMTSDMALKIVASPAVQDAYKQNGPLKVVCKPVENEMTGEVLPRGPREAFTARVRTLLARHNPGMFTWIMDRDSFYRLRQQELADVDLGPDPDAVSPQYVLKAKFQSMTKEDKDRRSSYYLCVYELMDLSERVTLWTDQYEVKKVAAKQFLD